ncbi:unnamed protein product [Diabrotica balteata]|uniref:Rab3 GTPase-activating protein catalytic subunit n=1 Tax=Diabrotica balteata TaxID=107213 RepID=A0A9P0E0F9_DIABA|nr:unnamed protein product [Diabrotica balteata]
MNEEIDESEFYHQDFTTASEWEVFMARMEEIINQWKVDETKTECVPDVGNTWIIKTEKIQFADTDFSLFLYCKQIESPDTSESDEENEKHKSPIDNLYDFELYNESNIEDHSCISSWYGLNEYIVLSPNNNSGITSESKIKVLLSSAYIVSSNLISSGNISYPRPIFVQIRDKWQKCYLGVFENEVMRTNFEMVHLRKGPPHCSYLTGLLDLFKTKIMSSCGIENILVSVQQSYTLSDFGVHVWKQDLLSEAHDLKVLLLPFGVTVEPINSLVLHTTWNHVPNHLIVDSENYTDFDPKAAMKWSLLIKTTSEPVCLLADALTEFFQNLSNQSTVFDILGDFAALPSNDSNPLDLLTEPAVPTISRLLNRASRQSTSRNKMTNNPPLSESVLVLLLYFLFPDADESTTVPYGLEEKDLEDSSSPASPKRFEADFKGFKTCPIDSLPWRLSIVLAHCLQSLGGIRAFAHIWYEFVQEMRYRWDKSMPIPGLPLGLPDLRTCLLSQKLQMLNCCIERRTCRENTQQSTYDSAEGSSTDDEFFDCSSEKPADEKAKEKYSLWNQPVGRKNKFGNLKLLKTGDPLYIPVTQEQVIKTEDQLQEDADFLLNLGSDAEASDLRARMMSSSLLSDMESFKAANPGAVVEDFIRWYSPRDWIENDNEFDEWGQKVGQLSPRMLIEDNNIWVETWESAKPVPAHRQRRLFDDTGEAEKVLQYLEMRTVSQICELMIPILSHCAIYRILDEYQTVMADHQEFSTLLSNLLRIGERLSRESKLQPRRFEAFIHEITSIELLISQFNSLQYKLNPAKTINEEIDDFVIKLVTGKEVEIRNKSHSDIGKRIIAMFGDAQKTILGEQTGDERNRENPVFPSPSTREFVMRVNAVKPAVYSAKCPQLLRAVLSKDEFRLVGAFSEDTAFF